MPKMPDILFFDQISNLSHKDHSEFGENIVDCNQSANLLQEAMFMLSACIPRIPSERLLMGLTNP
jgi:hypothetical protein